MKLLLDENLSPRLVPFLEPAFPGSAHVRDVGLSQVDDEAIWAFARDAGFAIASKDEDFHQRSFLYGHPPKVIWIRLGNCTTAQILQALLSHADAIREFNANAEAAFLVIS